MKNKIVATFWFVLLVIAGVEALHFLPVLNVGGKPLRKVDLLADIRKDEVVEIEVADSDTVVLPVVKPLFVDTCKEGMTCIEDYADSTEGGGMKAFYEALLNQDKLNRPLRIAYFGDSFIEADILTGDLRAMLQQRFGGCGVGYVPITSKVYGFRPTVRHSFSGWESHATTDSLHFDRSLQDISNHYFKAHPGASVTLSGQKKYASRLDTCSVSTFYFLSVDSVYLTAQINNGKKVAYALAGDSSLQAVSVRDKIGSVKWTVDKSTPSSVFYGVTMDSFDGIVLDNFSTRGSSGQQLAQIPLKILKQYNRLRTYDLIVLQYGLNVAFERGVNYTYYKESYSLPASVGGRNPCGVLESV